MSPPNGRASGPPDAPGRERLFNAPPAAVLLAVSMPLLFFFQTQSADGWRALAFAPVDLTYGRWTGLVTAMLLHGGWGHVIMNAIAALTFATPVARVLRGSAGLGAFIVLYVLCGVAGSLGYAAVHLNSDQPMVGASGAVFGLIGAATRMLGGHGRLLPLTDRRVITSSLAWMGVNAIVGLIGFAPGAEGARIAWEAHAFGFLAGLLLIGPSVRVFGDLDSGAPARARVESARGKDDPPFR